MVLCESLLEVDLQTLFGLANCRVPNVMIDTHVRRIDETTKVIRVFPFID